MYPLTSLEEILMSDPDGQQLQQRLSQLDTAVKAFSDEMRKPLHPDVYASLKRKRRSCLAAIKVLETLWLLIQPTAKSVNRSRNQVMTRSQFPR